MFDLVSKQPIVQIVGISVRYWERWDGNTRIHKSIAKKLMLDAILKQKLSQGIFIPKFNDRKSFKVQNYLTFPVVKALSTDQLYSLILFHTVLLLNPNSSAQSLAVFVIPL